MGVDRTLFLARKIDPDITREAVKRVVQNCERCQSIDPAPIVHKSGVLQVGDNWKRIAVDVTHYRNGLYLSIVDCGPGRVAIWRKLRAETAVEVEGILNGIFLERGPVDEVLMDNSTVFRSEALKQMFEKWNIHRFFRAAFRASGNGIVERNHRTIKAIAERGHISPLEAVFWYNMSPKVGLLESSVPQKSVFRYEWRHPSVKPDVVGDVDDDSATVRIGEEVWVKPPNARCTTQWGRGVITDIHSRNNVSVDGMPRHILDIRSVRESSDDSETDEDGVELLSEENGDSEPAENQVEEIVEPEGRPRRERRPPDWTRDYVME